MSCFFVGENRTKKWNVPLKDRPEERLQCVS